jgi:hypothetical protein
VKERALSERARAEGSSEIPDAGGHDEGAANPPE